MSPVFGRVVQSTPHKNLGGEVLGSAQRIPYLGQPDTDANSLVSSVTNIGNDVTEITLNSANSGVYLGDFTQAASWAIPLRNTSGELAINAKQINHFRRLCLSVDRQLAENVSVMVYLASGPITSTSSHYGGAIAGDAVGNFPVVTMGRTGTWQFVETSLTPKSDPNARCIEVICAPFRKGRGVVSSISRTNWESDATNIASYYPGLAAEVNSYDTVVIAISTINTLAADFTFRLDARVILLESDLLLRKLIVDSELI